MHRRLDAAEPPHQQRTDVAASDDKLTAGEGNVTTQAESAKSDNDERDGAEAITAPATTMLMEHNRELSPPLRAPPMDAITTPSASEAAASTMTIAATITTTTSREKVISLSRFSSYKF